MSDVFKIEGLDKLVGNLNGIGPKLAKTIIRQGVGAAAKLAKQYAIANTPISSRTVRRGSGLLTPPGTMRRAVIIKFDRTQSNDSQAVFLVTYRKGRRFQKGNRDAFYASWVEFGHRIVPRSARKGAFKQSITFRRRTSGGTVAGKHPLRDAFAPHVAEFVATMQRVWTAGFEAAVK